MPASGACSWAEGCTTEASRLGERIGAAPAAARAPDLTFLGGLDQVRIVGRQADRHLERVVVDLDQNHGDLGRSFRLECFADVQGQASHSGRTSTLKAMRNLTCSTTVSLGISLPKRQSQRWVSSRGWPVSVSSGSKVSVSCCYRAALQRCCSLLKGLHSVDIFLGCCRNVSSPSWSDCIVSRIQSFGVCILSPGRFGSSQIGRCVFQHGAFFVF